MKRLAKIQEYVTFKKVRFYTVCFEDDKNETEKFFDLGIDNPTVTEKLQQIATFIKIMGNEKGANKDFFRNEAQADALPPESKIFLRYKLDEFLNNNLRLYCMRLSDSVVVLFNGGIKTANKAQDCPNVGPKFRMAQLFAKKIDEKIRDRVFTIENKCISADDEEDYMIEH